MPQNQASLDLSSQALIKRLEDFLLQCQTEAVSKLAPSHQQEKQEFVESFARALPAGLEYIDDFFTSYYMLVQSVNCSLQPEEIFQNFSFTINKLDRLKREVDKEKEINNKDKMQNILQQLDSTLKTKLEQLRKENIKKPKNSQEIKFNFQIYEMIQNSKELFKKIEDDTKFVEFIHQSKTPQIQEFTEKVHTDKQKVKVVLTSKLIDNGTEQMLHDIYQEIALDPLYRLIWDRS